jgi:hypothetical protein
MLPVKGAEEVVQIGPLVLAKKPRKARPDDPEFRLDKNDPTSPTFKDGGEVQHLAGGGAASKEDARAKARAISKRNK